MNLSHVPHLHTTLRAQRDAKQTRRQSQPMKNTGNHCPWCPPSPAPPLPPDGLPVLLPMVLSDGHTEHITEDLESEKTIAPGSGPQAVRVKY